MVMPFYEDEPENNSPIQLLLEEVIATVAHIAPVMDYHVTPVDIPHGEGYNIDIYIQNREPIHAFLEVQPDQHITFGLLAEYLLRLVQREDESRDLFDASAN